MFDLIASVLRPGGKHLMQVCNAAYARRHFPRRHWEIGSRAISLADFWWDETTSPMVYVGYTLRYGEPLREPEGIASSLRLYDLAELGQILRDRGLEIRQAYGDYDLDTPASEDRLSLVVCSVKGLPPQVC